MPLTREQAQRVAARIAAAPALLPQSPEGRTELVDAFLRHCSNASHATAVMTELLDGCTNPVNVIGEICAIASRTRPLDQPPPGCEACSAGEEVSTGAPIWLPFVHVEVRGYSCARRCECQRGLWLLARDRARQQQQAEATQNPQPAFVAARDVDVKAGALIDNETAESAPAEP